MIITQKADYAFRIVQYLAEQVPERTFSMQMLSEKLRVPSRYSTTILQRLSKAGIIKSRRGLYGGYMLGKPAEEITYLDVLESVEGPLYVSPCVADPTFCTLHRGDYCPVHHKLEALQEAVREDMRRFTFESK